MAPGAEVFPQANGGVRSEEVRRQRSEVRRRKFLEAACLWLLRTWSRMRRSLAKSQQSLGMKEEATSSNSSSLTHARRPRVRPCGPCHTLRVLLTQCRLTALRPSGTSLRSCPNCLQAFAVFQNSSSLHSRPSASIRGSIYSFQLSAFSFQLLFSHALPPRSFATFAAS
jgi:hypothetical protein